MGFTKIPIDSDLKLERFVRSVSCFCPNLHLLCKDYDYDINYLLICPFLYLGPIAEFEYRIFVHVIDQCPQDSKLVVAILTDVLIRLKTYGASIEQACLRCDNAGCYHSGSTLLSIPTISEKSGVSIRRMDFADPQGGKGEIILNQ